MKAQETRASACMVSTGLIVRTAGSRGGIDGPDATSAGQCRSQLPFSGFNSMRDLLAKILVTQRVEVALLGAMAALLLLLSAVGIFALVATWSPSGRGRLASAGLGSTVGQAMVQIGPLRAGAFSAWPLSGTSSLRGSTASDCAACSMASASTMYQPEHRILTLVLVTLLATPCQLCELQKSTQPYTT